MIPEESQDQTLLDAMDEGVKAATPEPTDAPPEAPEGTQPDTPPIPPEAEKLEGDGAPADQKAEDAPKEGEPPKAEAEPEKKADDKPADQEAEAEIAKFGLKEQSAARFRELSSTVKELAPIRDQLQSAGVKVEDLPRVIQRAKDADELIGQVMDTGASPEQYGQTLQYLSLVNAAGRGDRNAAKQAFELWKSEGVALAKLAGEEVPGIHDPLADHADLAQRVENGDMPRDVALEVARMRAGETLSRANQEQTAKQAEYSGAVQEAENQLRALDAQFNAADPHYSVRRPALNNMVADIRKSLHPKDWAAATQRAYQQLALIPVAVPQQPKTDKPPVGPVRPGPSPSRNVAPTFDDPMEAMSFGIKQAGS